MVFLFSGECTKSRLPVGEVVGAPIFIKLLEKKMNEKN